MGRTMDTDRAEEITQRDEGNLYALQELLEGLAEQIIEHKGYEDDRYHSYRQMLKTVNKVIHNLSYGGYHG